MKKAVIFLMILSLTRVGVAYADTNSANNSSNYFFGVKNAGANLNQVLALLVGPEGKPGPAGVAGKDGLVGMNGVDGKDGLPGAPGVAGQPGKDGSSVLAVAFTGTQGNCALGGTKFSDGVGNVTYACNGANGTEGPQGPVGPQGPQGPAGAGGAGSLGLGQGEVNTGACEADGKVILGFTRTFTGTDFVFNQFTLGNPSVTNGDLKDTCATKTVSIYLKIGAGILKNTSGHYSSNDIIKCSHVLPAAAGWPTGIPQFTFGNSDLTCVNQTTNGSVSFNEISTADYTDRIGFEIG